MSGSEPRGRINGTFLVIGLAFVVVGLSSLQGGAHVFGIVVLVGAVAVLLVTLRSGDS